MIPAWTRETLPASVRDFIKFAKRHDWTWQDADDGRSYNAGKASEAELTKKLGAIAREFGPEIAAECYNRVIRVCPRARWRQPIDASYFAKAAQA